MLPLQSLALFLYLFNYCTGQHQQQHQQHYPYHKVDYFAPNINNQPRYVLDTDNHLPTESSIDNGHVEEDDTPSRCYSFDGTPEKCIPEFVNAAFNREVEVTNTCGVSRPQQYCLQTRGYGSAKACEFCDANDPYRKHPSHFLTDFNNNDQQTWWQSETMQEGIQYPNQVNITLKLGKAFDITYVRLFFRSPRPESFAIFKRTSEDSEWEPYQYYSATCRDTYGIPDSSYVRREDETVALCTSEFSDISPLTEGTVAFSTLENRPSRYDFETSLELQEWVTATEIKIVLDRLNTFRDEVFGAPQVLMSYFYAITDFAVGGRCKCNGHASQCVASTGHDGTTSLSCECQHHTTGRDCEKCLPYYNDIPWQRATADNGFECRPCNCNNFSTRCYFDEELYQKTGHGGHCHDCSANRAGPNCERCKDNFYEITNGECVACYCNEIGSRHLQCDKQGKCQCKSGVTGDKCDRCDENYFEFSPQGCKPCGCNKDGSYNNEERCDPVSGVCMCKANVGGNQCNDCKLGFFNLDAENDFGCTQCFCYGHSSECSSATGYSKAYIESRFVRGEERWTATDSYGRQATVTYSPNSQNIGVQSFGNEKIYFIAPERYLRDQRASYNHYLTFKLRVTEPGPRPSTEDVILEGNGFRLSAAIFAQKNSLPSTIPKEYRFRLHEDSRFEWSPRLNSRDFVSILSNLTAIKIRGTYRDKGRGFIDDVQLETAHRGLFADPATWIETCKCPKGYVGQFCESCAPGYRHDPPNGGRFASCIPCDCNDHADICDSETGHCICQHNTAGSHCEMCATGFYGNALEGSPDDCQPCPCPNNGHCIQLKHNTVVCLDCPKGYAGPRCEQCTDGYFGDPKGYNGAPRPCEKCDCNGNIDPNAVANCNRTSGECLKCIYNTEGFYCDQCSKGYYGDALAFPKGDCRSCNCDQYGTVIDQYDPPVCDQIRGQCTCKPHIVGRQCDECEAGYWNITGGMGCEPCNCDHTGSVDITCDVSSGRCTCLPGVTGRKCDMCEPYHYGFSTSGCQPCNCDTIGSTSLQCDATGQCPCRKNVEGRSCDRCLENTYDKQAGCRACPDCYNLVLDAVSIHRERLAELERLLADIVSNPTVISNYEFEKALTDVISGVDQLWNNAKAAASSGGPITVHDHLSDLEKRITSVKELLNKIRDSIAHGSDLAKTGENNITEVEEIIQKCRETLTDSEIHLDVQGRQAFDAAKDRSMQFGQQSIQMSKIARDARQLADKQEEEAKEIEDIASNAEKTSKEAFELFRKAQDDLSNITDILKSLGFDVDDLMSYHTNTLKLAETSLDDASKIELEALSINAQASSIGIPQIDANAFKEDAIEIKKDADDIKEDIDKLMSEHQDLLDEIDSHIIITGDLVTKGRTQQQLTAQLLSDVFTANKAADAAVEKADKTLEEAENTFQILQEFDISVQKSREDSKLALGKIGQIEALIDDAERFTEDAEHALTGAEMDARSASNTAKTAQDIAETASNHAGDVRVEADKTKIKASELNDEAFQLDSIVSNIDAELIIFENMAKEHGELVKTTQERANKAKSQADLASQTVNDASDTVREILEILERSPKLDSAELAALEERLERASRAYYESVIESSVNELTSARNWQVRQILFYEEEIRRLRLEVENIKEIKESLPSGCFNQAKLEP